MEFLKFLFFNFLISILITYVTKIGTNVNENAHSYLRKAENHFSGRISLPILELNLGLVINNINNNIDSASCKRDNYISQILWQELFTQRFNPHLYYNIKKKISYQHLKNCKFRCKWKYTEWTETEIAKLNKYMLQVTEGTYIKERALEDQYKYISRVILEDSKKPTEVKKKLDSMITKLF